MKTAVFNMAKGKSFSDFNKIEWKEASEEQKQEINQKVNQIKADIERQRSEQK